MKLGGKRDIGKLRIFRELDAPSDTEVQREVAGDTAQTGKGRALSTPS